MAVHVSPWLLLLLVTALTASDIVTSAQSAEGGLKTDDKDTVLVEDNGEFKLDEQMALAEKELLRAARLYGETYLASPSGRVVSCGKPPDDVNELATWSGKDWSFGDEVTYTCIDGYERTDGAGVAKLICGSGRNWKGPKIICTMIGCGKPADANSASKSFTDITFGAKVTYKCNAGYVRSAGNSTLTCSSNKEWIGTKPTCIRAKDCAQLYKNGITKSGVYSIKPFSSGVKTKYAYCDMETDGGGWTVFQHRASIDVDFYLKWVDYTNGFGNLTGNFWLGLDIMHALAPADESSVIRVDLQKFSNHQKAFAQFADFSIGDSTSKYQLKIGACSGTCSNDHFKYENSMKFSTQDNDNDKSGANCAINHHGAWWYNSCHQHTNLNARYYKSRTSSWQANTWYPWESSYGLEKSQMMFRPSNFKSKSG